MFGRQKRRDAQAIEAIREELSAADLRSRAMLANAIAQMELRWSKDLDQRKQLQAATEATIHTLQSSVTNSTSEVARALGQVANICAVVAEGLEAERLERRAFTEAIARVTRGPVAKLEGPSRIIGGTFFATSEIPDDADISLVDNDDVDDIDIAQHAEEPATESPHPGTALEVSTNGGHRQEARDRHA